MNLFHNHDVVWLKSLGLAAIVPLMLLLSCTKNGHSIDFPGAAAINIFNASHVYDSMANQRIVWFSGYDTTAGNQQLAFVGHGVYEIPSGGQPEAIRIDHPMNFYDFKSGQQQLKFMDTARNVVIDTTLNFSENSYNSLYLADDTSHVINASTRSGRFKLFNFPEDRTATPGKVRVRYIDLVPDMDTMKCYFFTPGGKMLTDAATPETLMYGSTSPYYDLDTAGLVVSGQILLRVFTKNDTARYKAQIPIPATPGRTYTVVVFGNSAYWLCSFPVTQADGSVTQRLLNYPPNIRGYVRTVY